MIAKSFDSHSAWQPNHLNLINWQPNQLNLKSTEGQNHPKALESQTLLQPKACASQTIDDNINHLNLTLVDSQIIWISNELTTTAFEPQTRWQPKVFESHTRWQPNHLNVKSHDNYIIWLSIHLNLTSFDFWTNWNPHTLFLQVPYFWKLSALPRVVNMLYTYLQSVLVSWRTRVACQCVPGREWVGDLERVASLDSQDRPVDVACHKAMLISFTWLQHFVCACSVKPAEDVGRWKGWRKSWVQSLIWWRSCGRRRFATWLGLREMTVLGNFIAVWNI